MHGMLTEGISIVIPIYKEKENIQLLFKKIIDFKEIAYFEHEFIIVDGFSNDGSLDVIRACIELNNLHHNVKVYSMASKNGYGYDIMFGLKNAHYNTLAWTHADLQTDLLDIVKGYEILKLSAPNTIVKGNRVGRNLIDTFLTRAMQIYTFIKTGLNISDINAQPKIFRRDLYNLLVSKNPPNDFSLDLYLLINAIKEDLAVKAFDVEFKNRLYGEAKGGGGSLSNRLALIKRTILYINNTSKNLN